MQRSWRAIAKYQDVPVDIHVYRSNGTRGIRYEDVRIAFVSADEVVYDPPVRLLELAGTAPQIQPDFAPYYSRSMGVAPWEAREGKGLPNQLYNSRTGGVLVRSRSHQRELMARLGYRLP